MSDDGLEIPEVGPWAKDKYHFLERYFSMFTTGMKNRWPERHYIDLFAGAGLARIRDSQEVVKASPLIAATLTDPFTHLHLCDLSEVNCAALRARLTPHVEENRLRVYQGDSNQLIDTIVQAIPDKALSIGLLDIFGTGNLAFSTVKRLASKHLDFIILIPDRMDVERNRRAYYDENPESNLDLFFGHGGWRELNDLTGDRFRDAFRKIYEAGFRQLGYEYFGYTQYPRPWTQDAS